MSIESDTDLYQWHHGSKLCTTSLEVMVTINEDQNCNEHIEVKIRGPRQSSKQCFYFFEQVLCVVTQVRSVVVAPLRIKI